MEFSEIISSSAMPYILPILIFLSRIFDVSLGTLRIIFVNRGMKYLAPIAGFFEVLIWLIVISNVMKNMDSPINYIAYAAGFAMGNFVGIYLEGKLAIGVILLRIITQKKAKELIQFFRAEGYHVTDIKATSNSGAVDVVYFNLRRRDLKTAIQMIKVFNPNAIYTITDMRLASKGMYPGWEGTDIFKMPHNKFLFKSGRKGK